jgi:hypothetical protein
MHASTLELLVVVSRFPYNHRSYNEPRLFEEKTSGFGILEDHQQIGVYYVSCRGQTLLEQQVWILFLQVVTNLFSIGR